MQNHRSSLISVMLLGIMPFVGCSGSGLPVVPVKGKITFAGGKPPAPVTITFAPLETADAFPRIPGKAVIAEDGTYYVVTEQAGQGLIPGRYVANIECWKVAPTMTAPAGVSHVPKDYRAAQELVVKSGSAAVEYNIDITTPPK